MHVLLAVDGSEESARASSFLAELIGDGSHDVTAVSVAEVAVPPFAPPGPAGVLAPATSDFAARGLARTEDELGEAEARAAERATAQAPPGADVEVGAGDPVHEILRVAEEVDADLVVVGTGDRGLVDRLLRGSVSRAVTRKADRSVLVVR